MLLRFRLLMEPVVAHFVLIILGVNKKIALAAEFLALAPSPDPVIRIVRKGPIRFAHAAEERIHVASPKKVVASRNAAKVPDHRRVVPFVIVGAFVKPLRYQSVL